MIAVPRPRKRAAGLVLGAAILFAVGTNVQAGWLSVLAALLLGAVAGGTFLPSRMVRGVRVQVRAPATAQQGDKVTVVHILSNDARGMRLGVVLDDAFLEPTSRWVGDLRPGERLESSTQRAAHRRGPNDGSLVTVRSTEPFGIARASRHVTVEAETLVHPRVEQLGELTFVDPAATTERAIHAWPRRGDGPEYLGIREYRPGDSMRHVHWPSTARLGTVMVREFEAEQTRRIAIVVDSTRDAGGSGDTWTPLDATCCAAASVAMAALTGGRGARLITGTGDHVEVLARTDGATLLDRLARLVPAGGPPVAELVGVLDTEVRGVDTVVLAFPTWRENAAEVLGPVVASLARRVPRTVAILVDADGMTAPGSGTLDPEGVDDLEASLVAGGTQVHRWRAASERLATCLERSGETT
jgi:uncharacterized protein (DUF58 family)